MLQQAEQSSGWPVLPVLLLLAGVAAAATGVALNESGVAAGRVLIVLGLPMAAVGGLMAVARRGRQRGISPSDVPRGAKATVLRAAKRHGLTIVENRAVGVVNQRSIELSADADDTAVVVLGRATRALDMGLRITRSREAGDARKQVTAGDATFDATYSVRADESPRAQGMLTPRLRSQLLVAHAAIEDEGATLRVAPGNDAALEQAIALVGKLIAEMERASNRVACAESLQPVRQAWLAFAEKQHLATADTPLSMWGQVQGLAVSATVVRDAFQHYHFEVEAKFPEPLNRGLALKPASSTNQFDRSGEPVGHPAFDKIFVVKSKDSADAPRLVGPETRQAILSLRDEGFQMRAHDGALWAWVGLSRADPEAIPRGLIRMVQIAARIVANAKRFPPS